MKRAWFTEVQIIGVLREHEAGAKTADLARKHGISTATLYNWKAKYGGMEVSEAKRLKQLEDENAKLKRLLADAVLDASALRELLAKNGRAAAQRDGVAHLRTALGLSERRACSIVGADRKMIRYRSRRPPETELRGRLRDLANARRRFGYRRLFILLREEGEASGVNRIYRLYREEGLTVRKRRTRRRAVGSRAPILVEARPNARWSLDFVHDQLANGRRFRILNIVDDMTRECLRALPDTSISGRRVAQELTALIGRGKLGLIVSDNGTELTSNAMLAWAHENKIVWHFIDPNRQIDDLLPWAYAPSANLKAVA
jgi:transposase InsO family protein